MTENKLRIKLAERRMSATALAERIPGMGKVCMSFIVNGIAMPNRETMTAICRELNCRPTDIYEPAELDIDITHAAQAGNPEKAEMVRWQLAPEQTAELDGMVKSLGYSGIAGWLMDMYRRIAVEYAKAFGDVTKLHGITPPVAVEEPLITSKS